MTACIGYMTACIGIDIINLDQSCMGHVSYTQRAKHTGIGDLDPRFRFRIPDSGFGIFGSGKQIQIQIQDSETWCQDLGSLIPDPRFCLSPLLLTIAYLCFSPL